ncbi:CRISPR-associated protein [Mycobacterium tuberculosis]|nr:CRISPR-associated protein [Mycobacterium tuberculosis]
MSDFASRATNLNRPGMSGDSSSWKGWGHVRWFIEEVPAGAA